MLKSRDITLPTKVCLVKAMVFPVVMYGCQSWTAEKAEHQRIDAFELWCWRRFLRVPWTVRRSNQSIVKEINPEYLLKGLRLKLRLQNFGHLMGRTDSLEKTLMLGKKAREEDGWMPSPAQWIWVWTSSKWWWRTGKPDVLQSMVPKSQTRLSDWTTTKFRRTPPYGTVRRWWGSHLHQTSLAPEEVMLSKPLPLSKWNVHICKVKALAIPKFTPTPTSYDSISKF